MRREMDSTGYFLPILIVLFVAGTIILCLIERMFEPKGSYEKWLKEELERNPDYIHWLKDTDKGKYHALGLKILAKIERDKNNSYYKWLKRMRKIGKY